MSPETVVLCSFGVWVAGILALLWLCIETAEAEGRRIELDELADAPAQEADRCAC
ncbi:hypothetical protein [Methylobacterium fujisawaense]|uniref:hypothetical protein n=1 Tax=Methylobacterium fujisawaense TaxID=107400 RepID=UPI00313D8733